jgi:hypothetical protein
MSGTRGLLASSQRVAIYCCHLPLDLGGNPHSPFASHSICLSIFPSYLLLFPLLSISSPLHYPLCTPYPFGVWCDIPPRSPNSTFRSILFLATANLFFSFSSTMTWIWRGWCGDRLCLYDDLGLNDFWLMWRMIDMVEWCVGCDCGSILDYLFLYTNIRGFVDNPIFLAWFSLGVTTCRSCKSRLFLYVAYIL